MSTTNPLLQSSKKPGTFVKLPSGGRFYDNPPTLTADGDIEVLPMNAIDELQMMNPDGLINNESLFSVLSHVVPSIKDPKEISNPDLDVLLLAMRMVTYGDDMDISTICAKCGNEDTFVMPLLNILSSVKSISTNTSVVIDDFQIEVKPYTLYSQTKLNQYIMNVQRAARKLELLDDNASSNEMLVAKTEMAETVNASAQELFDIAAHSITSITIDNEAETKNTVVTDSKFILEWLKSIAAPKYGILKDAIEKLSESCINRTFKFECTSESCNHKNEMEIDFDPANFFAIS